MRLNHVLVVTTDLAAMTEFFTSGIGLEQGARPPFPFAGAWFYSDNQPLVHVASTEEPAAGGGAINHLALEGANYDELIARLNKHRLWFEEKKVPETNERQVFIYGPDQLRVEMLFPIGTGSAVAHAYTDTYS